MCDEIIDAEETKSIAANFNEKKQRVKKNLHFRCLFISYNCIIHSC